MPPISSQSRDGSTAAEGASGAGSAARGGSRLLIPIMRMIDSTDAKQRCSLDNCTDALAARVAATGAKAAELHGTYRPRITALRAELEDYVRRKYADAYEKGYSVCPGVWVIDSSHQLPTQLKARRRARE